MVMEDGVVTSRTVDGVPQAIEYEANKKKEKKKKSGESKHTVHVLDISVGCYCNNNAFTRFTCT